MEHFFSLTPDRILGAVETALGCLNRGVRASGRSFALNSLENRVYDIELDDDSHVIAKFYRPGRWSEAAILAEHRFLAQLVAAEVPAVAPLEQVGASTLTPLDDGIWMALFPKVQGRTLQELDDGELERIGRLLARLHNVGAAEMAPARPTLTVEYFGVQALASLAASGLVDMQVWPTYQRTVESLLGLIDHRLKGVPTLRIHGDCHLGNVLWRGDGPFFVDFDDFVNGPAVQDLWMLVRGWDEEAVRQREVVLAGYQQMRQFDRATLSLIEPLRALRIVHYASWIARRWKDPIFPRMFPDFDTHRFWADELHTLEEQRRRVEASGQSN